MLQAIRDKAQGWFAWGIVILISIPFALWGIQEYLGVGAEPVVATVNGKEITDRALNSRYQNFRQDLRQRLGAAYRPELFDDARMRKEVLQEMIRSEVILQASYDMGLRAGDRLVRSAILGMPTFQKSGRFDQETFERAVRLQGTSAAGFEERIRRILLSEQLSQAVNGTAFVTDFELKEKIRLQDQAREFAFFAVPWAKFASDEAISDASVQAYYEKHQQNYRVPEQVKLEYILLDADSLSATIEADEAVLHGYYDDHLENYGRPEQRRASHILVLVGASGDESEVDVARKKIEALKARAEQGEDFAELAKSASQDPGSAANGGDLGFFGKGIMDPAFETATYALQDGELSAPVRSAFGFHLIKLTGIKAGDVKSFEEVRDEVTKAYKRGEAERIYYEYAERLADLSYEDPGSLEPASNTLGLDIKQSDWIGREGGAGILAFPKLLGAAFSEDVLNEHNNSELIELDQNQSVVLRVLDHKEAAYRALDEVKATIVAAVRNEQAEKLAKAEAEKRVGRLKAGEPIDAVAGEFELTKPGAVKRRGTEVPLRLLAQVFRTPKPASGEVVSGVTRLGDGDFAVFSLSAVVEGSVDSLDQARIAQEKRTLSNYYGRQSFEDLVKDLRERAEVTVTVTQSESE